MKKLYLLCRLHYNRKLVFTSASMPRRRTTHVIVTRRRGGVLIPETHEKKKRETAESSCETGPIIEKAGSVHIKILAKPGAKYTSILDVGEQEVGVQIAAPPVDGEANEELIKYLSKLFGVKKSHIAVEKGIRSRSKVVKVSGASKEAIEGLETTVELRGEREVTGTLLHVDGYMNITMKYVTFKSLSQEKKFVDFFVNGRNIRYVHIPDEVDMKKAMEATIQKFCTRSANLRVNQEIKDRAWEKLKKRENIAKRNFRQETQ